jgi:hypothetical protein
MWTGLVWLRIGTSGESSCESGNERLGSIKCWKAIEWPASSGLSSSAQPHRVS